MGTTGTNRCVQLFENRGFANGGTGPGSHTDLALNIGGVQFFSGKQVLREENDFDTVSSTTLTLVDFCAGCILSK